MMSVMNYFKTNNEKTKTKIITPNDNISEIIKTLKDQRRIKKCLIPQNYPYEDEYPSSPTYQQMLFKLHNLSSDIVPETKIIRELLLRCPDVETAYNECKAVGSELSFRNDQMLIWHLGDSMDIDSYFVDIDRGCFRNKGGYVFKCITLMKEKTYLGHVWYYTHPDFPEYCGIYGIKTSIVNLISKNSMGESCPDYRKGISYKLLDEVENIAKLEKRKTIIVPWPLDAMRYILSKRGFSEINTSEDIPERLFLSKMASTSNLFVMDLYFNIR